MSHRLDDLMRPSEGAWQYCEATLGRNDLAEIFAWLGYRQGAEIGVWKGGFSVELCERIPGLHLVCIDPWAAYPEYGEKKNDPGRLEEAYREACHRLSGYDTHILRMTSHEAAAHVPDRSLDFVYLDGNHAAAYVRADLELWTPKVKPGGIVAGHDYEFERRHPWIEVRAVVDAWTREHAIAPWYIFGADRSATFAWGIS